MKSLNSSQALLLFIMAASRKSPIRKKKTIKKKFGAGGNNPPLRKEDYSVEDVRYPTRCEGVIIGKIYVVKHGTGSTEDEAKSAAEDNANEALTLGDNAGFDHALRKKVRELAPCSKRNRFCRSPTPNCKSSALVQQTHNPSITCLKWGRPKQHTKRLPDGTWKADAYKYKKFKHKCECA